MCSAHAGRCPTQPGRDDARHFLADGWDTDVHLQATGRNNKARPRVGRSRDAGASDSSNVRHLPKAHDAVAGRECASQCRGNGAADGSNVRRLPKAQDAVAGREWASQCRDSGAADGSNVRRLPKAQDTVAGREWASQCRDSGAADGSNVRRLSKAQDAVAGREWASQCRDSGAADSSNSRLRVADREWAGASVVSIATNVGGRNCRGTGRTSIGFTFPR